MRCIVYLLRFSLSGEQLYLIKSADCSGVRGEGATCEDAKSNFKASIEAVVFDGDGGIFYGQSSETFQSNFFGGLEKGWGKDKVEIVTKSFCVIKIF